MKPAEMVSENSAATQGGLEERPVVKKHGWRRMAGPLMALGAMALVGVLVTFVTPVKWVIAATAAAGLLAVMVKFVRDNRRLVRQIGMRRLALALGKATLCFLPLGVLLVPGFYLGSQVNVWTNKAAAYLQSKADPDRFKELISGEKVSFVEELVKIEVPWYYAPMVWAGYMPDVEKKSREMKETVYTVVTREVPKPWPTHMWVGLGKGVLACVSVYSFVWMGVLFARAYGSVLGRVLVAGDPAVEFGVGEAGPPKQGGEGESGDEGELHLQTGANMVLGLEPGDEIFVRASDLPVNAMPDMVARLRGGCFLLRLRRGLVALYTVKGGDTVQDVTFHAAEACHYVSVVLEEGQEVVVDPARLVGFSGTVRFSSHWDFNLAVMALGRCASMVAKGPGWLLLKCAGQPATYWLPSEAPVITPDKLFLFGREARFQILGSGGYLNYLASGCAVKPVAGRCFVAAPEAPRLSSFLARFWALLKQVYVPV